MNKDIKTLPEIVKDVDEAKADKDTVQKISDKLNAFIQKVEGVVPSVDEEIPHIVQGVKIEADTITNFPKVTSGQIYHSGKYNNIQQNNSFRIKSNKGLLYVNENNKVEFKPFSNPKDAIDNLIKEENAETIISDAISPRYVTDFSVEYGEEEISNLVSGDSKYDNLVPKGAVVNLSSTTPISWKVPYDTVNSNKVYWATASKSVGFDGSNGFTIVQYLIPNNGSDVMTFHLATATGYAYNIYFRLCGYDADSDSYSAEFYVNKFLQFYNGSRSKEYPVRVFRNKPCLLVLECSFDYVRWYVNGKLAVDYSAKDLTYPATAEDATIEVNSYNKGYHGSITPLFLGIYQGCFGKDNIARLANQIGVPTEYAARKINSPRVYQNKGHIFSFDVPYPFAFFRSVGDENSDKDGNSGWTLFGDSGMSGNQIDKALMTYDPYPAVVSPSFKKGNSIRTHAKNKNFFSVTQSDGGRGRDSVIIKGERVSAFFMITLKGDGVIISNGQDGTKTGITFDVVSKKLGVTINGVTKRATKTIQYNQPVIVGFVFDEGECRIYSDSTEPTVLAFEDTVVLEPHDSKTNSTPPLCLGAKPTYAANAMTDAFGKSFINADWHACIISGDTAYSEEDVKNIFNAYSYSYYKNIIDDMMPNPNSNVTLGMIKTNNEGSVELIETTPMWGVRKNPQKNRKYFIGWFKPTATAGKYYQIPNPYGSSRVKINVYAKNDKNTEIVETVSTNTLLAAGGSDTNPWGITKCVATPDYIQYYARANPTAGAGEMGNVYGHTGATKWLGFEVEPFDDLEN